MCVGGIVCISILHFSKAHQKTDAKIKYGQVEISVPTKRLSPAYGSEVLGKNSQLPNLLEMNPGIRELKHLLIGFLSSYFNLLSFFWTALWRQSGSLLRHTNETHPSASVIARLSFLLEVRDERSGQVLSRLQYLIISKHARWPQAVKATSI